MVPLLSRSVRKFRGGRGSEGVKNGTGYFYVDCRSRVKSSITCVFQVRIRESSSDYSFCIVLASM
jgi:hypothetical protein